MGGGIKVGLREASLALALVTALAACGTDATGPETSVAGDRGRSRAPRPATVYVVHGINGRDLGLPEALPVDVQVGGACALPGFTFRTIAGPLALPAGRYDITVRLANPAAPCTGAAVIAVPGAALASGANVSIVAHLDAAGAPTASIFGNETRTRDGRARVTARHTAAFGPVDVLVNRAVAFADVVNGQQGSAQVRSGRTRLAINPANQSASAWQATLTLQQRRVYVAYAVGTPAKGTFEVLLQVLAADRAGDDGDDDDDDDEEDDDDDDRDDD